MTCPAIPISTLLRNLINEDAEAAIHDAQKAADNPKEYNNDELGINRLGYALLADNPELANKVFKLNCEINPNSFNVYDSYGEGLLQTGDTALAIKNYIQSVVYNPDNTNGIEILRSLGVQDEEFLPDIVVTATSLDRFVGKYELNTGLVFTITREGTSLFVEPSGQYKSELFPASEYRFYSKAVAAQVTFHRDDAGKVTGLTLHQGGDYPGERVIE